MTKKMTPEQAWAQHSEAVETARLAEAARERYRNYQTTTNVHSNERLASDPEYVALIADRDATRDAEIAADPRKS